MSSTRSSATVGSRLLAAARVHHDESSLVAWMATFFTVTQASHGVAANTADALFLDRFGVERLPLMIFVSGLAVMFSTLAYSNGLARVGARRWLRVTTAFGAFWALLEWAVIFTEAQLIYPVIWVSAQVLIFLTLTVMWNAASSACNTRQAKRLFPLFASAGVAGGILGNLLVGPLANLLGTENLLVVQAVLLVASTMILGRLVDFFAGNGPGVESRPGAMRRAVATVASSPLLKLAAVVIALLFAIFYLVVFPFNEAVAAAFDTEAEIAGFLGLFSSIATAATFLFSLFFTNRLLGRLGLVMTLLIVPVAYAAGFSLWLISFGLLMATLVRGAQWVAVNAIQGTAYSALFNVLSTNQRGPVLALMTAVPAQVGTMVAGLALIVAEGFPQSTQFALGLVLAAGAVVTVMKMRPAYISAVVAAVRKGLVGMFDVPHQGVISPVDADAAQVLAEHLDDSRPQARALVAASLARAGTSPEVIEPLLEDDDPLVRTAAFDSICEVEPDLVERHVSKALSDESPGVRLHAVRYLAVNGPVDLPPAAQRQMLNDPDPRVRSAAAWLIGGDSGMAAVSQMLSEAEPATLAAVLGDVARAPGRPMGVTPGAYLEHADPPVRAAAATAHAATRGDLALLVPRLEDPSLRVRKAAAEALAKSDTGRELLVAVLGEGSVMATEAALRAVSPIREADSESFLAWAGGEARRAARLDGFRRAIEGEASSPEERFLVDVLTRRAERLVQWVLLAMTTEKTRRVMPIVGRGVRSDDPETNAQAIEALETLGARSVLEVLLPLLESEGSPSPLDREDALIQISDDFDPWLSSLAALCLQREGDAPPGSGAVPGWNPMSPEPGTDLDDLGRVLVIQAVPMFSGLDPEDLLLVAQATTEVYFDSGERIYHEGDPGTELLLIVGGSVEVTRSRGEQRQMIETYSEGDHVGELSLLYGGDRSADVEAGPAGVHGLVLSKTDLLSILEERPSVALGMLSTLARRLVEQT